MESSRSGGTRVRTSKRVVNQVETGSSISEEVRNERAKKTNIRTSLFGFWLLRHSSAAALRTRDSAIQRGSTAAISCMFGSRGPFRKKE